MGVGSREPVDIGHYRPPITLKLRLDYLPRIKLNSDSQAAVLT